MFIRKHYQKEIKIKKMETFFIQTKHTAIIVFIEFANIYVACETSEKN